MKQRLASFRSVGEFSDALKDLRGRLESVFNPDTALGRIATGAPSAGHCAATAAILHTLFGATLLSANVCGRSHWFNRFRVGEQCFDADITGDQFGLPSVRIEAKNALFEGTRERSIDELNEETLERAELLAERAQLQSWISPFSNAAQR